MSSARVDTAALNSSLRRLDEQRDDSDLFASLRRVIDFSGQLFNVNGGGLMLADDNGDLRYVVASTGPSHLLEQAQIDTGQGPCVDTYLRDDPTISRDLANDDRYPVLAPLVVPQGIGAVLGVPVHLSDMPIGSLDLYVDRSYDFDQSELDALTRYGEVVEAMIHAAVTASHAGNLADQLTYALEHRVPIERAVGYLMARDAVPQPRAFQTLRAAARAERRKVGEVAAELLDTGRLPGETAEAKHKHSQGRSA
jgi:transcriptional regulator with GAF, ATPase, and Fis domain